MRKRQNSFVPGLSLFPFMSILVCLIGSLVMIIVGITIVQFNQNFNIEMLKEYESLLKTIEKIVLETNKVDRQIEKTALNPDLQKRLEAARNDLKYLKFRESQTRSNIEDAEDTTSGKVDTQESLTELENRFVQLKKDLDYLDQKINNQGEKLTGSTLMLTRSSGSGEGYRASFMECSGNSVILHPDKSRIIQKSDLEGDVFITHLKRINNEKRVAVFLIRDDGVSVFEDARVVAKKYCDKIGFLPLPGDGPIDFTTFKEN